MALPVFEVEGIDSVEGVGLQKGAGDIGGEDEDPESEGPFGPLILYSVEVRNLVVEASNDCADSKDPNSSRNLAVLGGLDGLQLFMVEDCLLVRGSLTN